MNTDEAIAHIEANYTSKAPVKLELPLDDAMDKFKAYCEGEGDFDELDFKEVVVDMIRDARLDELHELWATVSYRGDKAKILGRINELKSS